MQLYLDKVEIGVGGDGLDGDSSPRLKRDINRSQRCSERYSATTPPYNRRIWHIFKQSMFRFTESDMFMVRTFIRRLRQVKHPVFVLLLISFLCRPPDIIRPSEGGRGYRIGWLGSEVTLICCCGRGNGCPGMVGKYAPMECGKGAATDG